MDLYQNKAQKPNNRPLKSKSRRNAVNSNKNIKQFLSVRNCKPEKIGSNSDTSQTSDFTYEERSSYFCSEKPSDDSFDLFLPTKFKYAKESELVEDKEPDKPPKSPRKSRKVVDVNGLKQCAICLSSFSNLTLHMKACIEKNNITKDQLKLAIELQEKYEIDRINLGISPNYSKLSEGGDRDLKKAIELSLLDPKAVESECASKQINLKWNGKTKKAAANALLLSRTQKERERIITEKVAIVLMQENSDEFISRSFELKSEQLVNCQSEDPILWKKSSLEPQKISLEDFYVGSLGPLIEPEIKSKDSQKLYSSNDRSDLTTVSPLIPEASCAKGDSDNCTPVCSFSLEIEEKETQVKNISEDSSSTQFPPFSLDILEPDGERTILNQNIQAPSGSSKHLETLSQDWESLVGKKKMSDVTINLMDGSTMYAHTLVFCARCVKMLDDVKEDNGFKIINWKEISFEAGHSFLTFLYSGRLDQFSRVSKSDLTLVKKLAEKYGIGEVLSSLSSFPNLDIEEDIPGKVSGIDIKDSEAEIKEDRLSQASTIGFVSDGTLSPDLFLEGGVSPKYSLTPRQTSERSEAFDFANESLNKRRLSDSYSPPVGSFTKKIRESKSPNDPDRAKDIDLTLSDENSEPVVIKIDSESNSSNAFVCSGQNPICISDNEASETGSPCRDVEHDYLMNGFDAMCENGLLTASSPYDRNIETPKVCNTQRNSAGKNSLEGYFRDSFPDNSLLNQLCVSPETQKSSEKAKEDVEEVEMISSSPVGEKPEEFKFSKTRRVSEGAQEVVEIRSSTPDVRKSVPLSTPSPQIIMSDKATPQADYSAMITPQLKNELRKYGLNPGLDKGKAKLLLRYIYDQIHPIVDEPSTSAGPVGQPQAYCLESKGNSLGDPIDPNESDMSDTGVLFEYEPEDPDELASVADHDETECHTLAHQDDLSKRVLNYIKGNGELYENVLKYIPISLDKLRSTLKDNGIKCKLNELMDILDSECITFRSQRPREKGTSKVKVTTIRSKKVHTRAKK